jgi:probable rRNA maturation factor
MIRCNIFNDTGYLFDQELVRNRVTSVIEEKANEKGNFEVDIYIVGEEAMKKIHKEFMDTYEVTDVLSFPLEYDKSIPDDIIRLGDVVICFEVAQKQANEFDKLLQTEIDDLAEHGTLHLLGYHHDE